MKDFRLIETMRVSETGEIILLERHLERLRNSARYFSFKYDSSGIRDRIMETTSKFLKPARVRFALSEDGIMNIEPGPLPENRPERLKLSVVRVQSLDPFLQHKSTKRGVFETARQDCNEHTDVLLMNERGEITETTIANVAVFRRNRWITPPILCGLLPGVMRAELLSRGEIEEAVIAADDLQRTEVVRCFNALRGVWDATLV